MPFSACVSDHWQLAIGDPNITDWAICAAYALAASLAVIVLRVSPFDTVHRSREKILWALIAGLMAALALNKQLDLQSLMLATGRCLAQEQGWYDSRRLVQRDFIFALIALAAVMGGVLIWLLRGIMRHNLIALIGLATVAGFVSLRGGHLFHIFAPQQKLEDVFLHDLTSTLEVIGPIFIIAAAWGLLRNPRQMSASG
jgi:hypothetical protein